MKSFLPETRGDGGTVPQSLVSVPNIPGLNPKFLHNAYDVKAYVLLIVILHRMGTLSLVIPLVSFEKSRLIPTPSFPFNHPHLIFFAHTLQNLYIQSS